MGKTRFEWDEEKDKQNQVKHSVSFSLAQHAFLDPCRIIAEDVSHSGEEERFYCIGRANAIRIFGAGYWRKRKRIYEEQNKIY